MYTYTIQFVLLVSFVTGIFFLTPAATAEERYVFAPVLSLEHVRFNNENWFTVPHPKVAEFTRHIDGSTSGFTENGIPFLQYAVPNTYGIHVERFEIEDHYHYIIDGNIIESFEDFSIALANAYEAQHAV